jgi:hypothetical protein
LGSCQVDQEPEYQSKAALRSLVKAVKDKGHAADMQQHISEAHAVQGEHKYHTARVYVWLDAGTGANSELWVQRIELAAIQGRAYARKDAAPAVGWDTAC